MTDSDPVIEAFVAAIDAYFDDDLELSLIHLPEPTRPY